MLEGIKTCIKIMTKTIWCLKIKKIIQEMRINNLYYLNYSDYCFHLGCYLHNVLACVTSSFLQTHLFKLGNLYWISNQTFYLIYRVDYSRSDSHGHREPLIKFFYYLLSYFHLFIFKKYIYFFENEYINFYAVISSPLLESAGRFFLL